jgi:hypothetical protein
VRTATEQEIERLLAVTRHLNRIGEMVTAQDVEGELEIVSRSGSRVRFDASPTSEISATVSAIAFVCRSKDSAADRLSPWFKRSWIALLNAVQFLVLWSAPSSRWSPALTFSISFSISARFRSTRSLNDELPFNHVTLRPQMLLQVFQRARSGE